MNDLPVCFCGGVTTSLACRDAADGGMDTDRQCLRCGAVQTVHEGPECFLPPGTLWVPAAIVEAGLLAYVEAGGTSGRTDMPYTDAEMGIL